MRDEFILDTSPLIILTIGLFNKDHLHKVKYGNRKFEKVDFDLLHQYIYKNKTIYENKIIVSPQILAELCNIVENNLGRELFKQYMQTISYFLREGILEVYTHKDILINVPEIIKFGFSDISVSYICSNNRILIVGDLPFYQYCKSNKLNVEYLDTILAPKYYTNT